MKVIFTIRSKKWFKKPSIKFEVEDMTSLDQVDQVIQALHQLKHEADLIKHFHQISEPTPQV